MDPCLRSGFADRTDQSPVLLLPMMVLDIWTSFHCLFSMLAITRRCCTVSSIESASWVLWCQGQWGNDTIWSCKEQKSIRCNSSLEALLGLFGQVYHRRALFWWVGQCQQRDGIYFVLVVPNGPSASWFALSKEEQISALRSGLQRPKVSQASLVRASNDDNGHED